MTNRSRCRRNWHHGWVLGVRPDAPERPPVCKELNKDGKITDGDFEAVERFLEQENGAETSTLAEYLKRLRLKGERAETPLTEMADEDLHRSAEIA